MHAGHENHAQGRDSVAFTRPMNSPALVPGDRAGEPTRITIGPAFGAGCDTRPVVEPDPRRRAARSPRADAPEGRSGAQSRRLSYFRLVALARRGGAVF
jgi:hypothetical protein